MLGNMATAPNGSHASTGSNDVTNSIAACRAELNEIRIRCGPHIEFMRTEFDRLERELVPNDSSDVMAVQRHDRLVYFIRHLQQTTGQLQNMESRVIAGEQNHPSVASEDWGVVLENLQNVKRHILTSLMPIKERLEMQLYGPPTGGRGPARLGPAPSDQHGVHSRPVGGGGGGLGSYGYPPHRGGGHPTQQMHPHHVAQHQQQHPPPPHYQPLPQQHLQQPPHYQPLPQQQQQHQHHDVQPSDNGYGHFTQLQPSSSNRQRSPPMQHQQHQQQPAGYRGTVTQIPCAAGVMVGGSGDTAFEPTSSDHRSLGGDATAAAPRGGSTRQHQHHQQLGESTTSVTPPSSLDRVPSGLDLRHNNSMLGLEELAAGDETLLGHLDELAADVDWEADGQGGGGAMLSRGPSSSRLSAFGSQPGNGLPSTQQQQRYAGRAAFEGGGAGAAAIEGGAPGTSGSSSSSLHHHKRGAGGYSGMGAAKRPRGEDVEDNLLHDGGGGGGGSGEDGSPKTVQYICSACGTSYPSLSMANPWWAITREPCPKCNKMQIPRIDIADEANQIEYHPALIRTAESERGGADDGNGDGEGVLNGGGGGGMHGEDGAGDGSGDDADGLDDSDPSMRLPPEQAAKLLVLITHARTCPGHHVNRAHSEVCKSVKYLMLHIRDCCGTLPDGSECPFPWCRQCKYLIHHLVKCQKPSECSICSPKDLPPSLAKLRALNQEREEFVKQSKCAPCADSNAAVKLTG